jgi:hypothetical protein
MMSRPDSQSFRQLIDTLTNAEQQFLESRNQTADVEIAENYHHLFSLFSVAMDFYLFNDWERPHFVDILSPYRKMGGDNAHALYNFAPVLPDRSYRIRGSRGGTAYLGFTLYGGETEEAVQVHTNTNSAEIAFETTGDFEIVLSPRAQDDRAANHIRLRGDSSTFVVRQYFHDNHRAPSAALSIEPLDDVGKPPPLSGERLAAKIRSMTRFVRGWVNLSPIAYPAEDAAYNQVCPPFNTGQSTGHWSTPDNIHAFGFFKLAADEALVLHGRSTECLYWSCHLWNACMQTFDYTNYQCAIAKRQVQLEPDGSWKLVIAHRNPGCSNWLDTAGHQRGFIYFRWLQSDGIPPAMESQVVRLSDLG